MATTPQLEMGPAAENSCKISQNSIWIKAREMLTFLQSSQCHRNKDGWSLGMSGKSEIIDTDVSPG